MSFMQTQTLIYIIISGIIALLLALFQYLYNTKRNRLHLFFGLLRFISYFSLLLLLVNPKIYKKSIQNIKPDLVVATDNSSSIKYLGYDNKVLSFLQAIEQNAKLNDKFSIDYYSFSSNWKSMDTMDFKGNRTNIGKVLNRINQVYKNSEPATLLISDGNQTYGQDYLYTSKNLNQIVFPVIIGDTTSYNDIRIEQLNVNRYAFLKNKFPVEVFLAYDGDGSINTVFQVSLGKSIVYNKPISFSKDNNSVKLDFTLPANSVGLKTFKAKVDPLDSEKNIINNERNFAVDVINQKTNIAVISDLVHPDLGLFKKSIEANEQRTVSILTPKEYLLKSADFQLVILYQPNSSFKSVFKRIDQIGCNVFLISGTYTDWDFLNNVQNYFKKKVSNLNEDFQTTMNINYSTFQIEDIDFESFPPLKSNFDPVEFSVNQETLLFKSINNINTEDPLLCTFEVDGRRYVFLLGEDIWKWRAQSFLNEQSFDKFDEFMGKLIQYLSTNLNKSRLNVTFEQVYNSNDDIVISAQFFNKNFELDNRANLSIVLTNKVNGEQVTFPFVFSNDQYQVNLGSLPASDYDFLVKVENESLSKKGYFKILEYSVEQQFINANVTKLQQVATNTSGKIYYIDNVNQLLEDLLNDERFQTVQVSHKNSVPLIDFRWLLGLIAISLATEWFLRKFNGLI